MRLVLALACAIFFALVSQAAMADSGPIAAPTSTIAVQSLPPAIILTPTSPQAGFDPVKATNAYLAQIHGAARARSDAYFEGGYVLLFVDTAYAVIVSVILLSLGLSARMREIAGKITRRRFWQVPIYVALYTILTTAMTLPLTIYEDFFREHAFGLSNQTFLQWLGDFGTLFLLGFAGSTIMLTIVYVVIRQARKTWWIWGAFIATAFLVFEILITPVFIAPLLNHYQPLKSGALKSEILSIARAEGIPATDVYEFDASRQSKRISANVSGLWGTTRISMDDNLLKRCTHDQIIAVLGHEMGHYVLDHMIVLIVSNGLLYLAGLAFLNWGFGVVVKTYGKGWGVRGIEDPAGLPVLAALLSVFFLLTTPLSNTITRTVEAQADIFGVNAVRKPDGFAQATLMLSEYRKLDPSPLEEFVFYDHPSGRSRISMVMRWKAEHLNDWDIRKGPVSPR